MRRLIHLSDLHFGRDQPGIADALVAEINAHRPDLVLVSGDLTQDGKVSEFESARRFLDRLEAHVLCVPGNHDLPSQDLVERLTDPYARWRRIIAAEIEPFWHDDEVAVIGVNTARRAAFHWNWAHGRISDRQLQRVTERLSTVPATLVRIVIAHHPLFLPDVDIGMKRVRRADAALKSFAAAGVRLVLSGHFHVSFVREHGHEVETADSQPGIVAVEGGRRPLLAVHAATSISSRVRGEPNAYNRISITNGNIAIEVRIWDGEKWRIRETATATPVLPSTPAEQTVR